MTTNPNPYEPGPLGQQPLSTWELVEKSCEGLKVALLNWDAARRQLRDKEIAYQGGYIDARKLRAAYDLYRECKAQLAELQIIAEDCDLDWRTDVCLQIVDDIWPTKEQA